MTEEEILKQLREIPGPGIPGWSPREVSGSVIFDDPATMRALLAPGIAAAQEAINRNLKETMWGDAFAKQWPQPPWYVRAFRFCRRRLGEKIADFASWVAGYDVRGE